MQHNTERHTTGGEITEAVSIVACVLSIAGKVCVNYKKSANFVLFMAGYVLWLVYYACTTPNIPQMVMYAVYAGLSVHGLIKWRKS